MTEDLSPSIQVAKTLIGGLAARTRLYAGALLLVLAGVGVTIGIGDSVIHAQSSTIASLRTTVTGIQQKSTEQTKVEQRLQCDVSSLVGVAAFQAQQLSNFHSANTAFFELIREYIVSIGSADPARLARVERHLDLFRFPRSVRVLASPRSGCPDVHAQVHH